MSYEDAKEVCLHYLARYLRSDIFVAFPIATSSLIGTEPVDMGSIG